jgi:MoaA/NifB/PqqE/SkfB family radical SAM enzyme
MKDDHGNGSGSHGMPHGMPEGTIKEVYSQIKEHGDGKVSNQYMKNMENKLRLVFWETTAGCNLECIHCRRIDVSTQLMNDDLTTKESFELVDAIVEAGNPILVLSGGEPLFRPDIFDIAKYAVSKGLTVALATNGTLVDEDMAKKIVDSGVSRVAISLDGADADTHDEFRKLKGSFELAIK